MEEIPPPQGPLPCAALPGAWLCTCQEGEPDPVYTRALASWLHCPCLQQPGPPGSGDGGKTQQCSLGGARQVLGVRGGATCGAGCADRRHASRLSQGWMCQNSGRQGTRAQVSMCVRHTEMCLGLRVCETCHPGCPPTPPSLSYVHLPLSCPGLPTWQHPGRPGMFREQWCGALAAPYRWRHTLGSGHTAGWQQSPARGAHGWASGGCWMHMGGRG